MTTDGLARRRLLIDGLEKRLEAVSPQQVLRRGYSMTFSKRDGKLIRSAVALKPGDRLLTRFADGQVESVVEDLKQLKLFD
jgi:exodeoxyribonuclease VII large subunit